MYWLIVITFMGGSTWAPISQTIAMPSMAACVKIRDAQVNTLVKMSATNLNGGAQVEKKGSTVELYRASRQFASLSCEETSQNANGG